VDLYYWIQQFLQFIDWLSIPLTVAFVILTFIVYLRSYVQKQKRTGVDESLNPFHRKNKEDKKDLSAVDIPEIVYPKGLKEYNVLVEPKRFQELKEILVESEVKFKEYFDSQGIKMKMATEKKLLLDQMLKAGLIKMFEPPKALSASSQFRDDETGGTELIESSIPLLPSQKLIQQQEQEENIERKKLRKPVQIRCEQLEICRQENVQLTREHVQEHCLKNNPEGCEFYGKFDKKSIDAWLQKYNEMK